MDNFKKFYGEHKKLTWIVVAVIVVLFGIGRIHSNGGLLTPKELSFAQQLEGKQHGTHVWLYSEGQAKDSYVDDIYVVKNGKMIQYQLFDDDMTLGKLSKMNDKQLISLGKKQDRKYFDESINEVKSLRDNGSNSKYQLGLQNDLFGSKALKVQLAFGPKFYYWGTNMMPGKEGPIQNIKFYPHSIRVEGDYMTAGINEDQIASGSLAKHIENEKSNEDQVTEENNRMKDKVRTMRLNSLIKNMENVKYLAPKYQTCPISSKTDDTGNDVVSQKINYKSIDEFDEDAYAKDAYKAVNKAALASFISNRSKASEDHKAFNADKYTKQILTPEYFDQATKNIFHPNLIDNYMELQEATSFKIYDHKMIGYYVDDGNCLTTVAQNNKQKAVMK